MLEQQDGQSIVLQPVESAARQLVQLSLHYLVNQPGRICAAGRETPLPDAAAIGASPRMVVFVDVPPGARFLPQAAELNDGRVVTFFGPLIEKLKRDCGTLPGAYPHTTATEVGRRQRDAYWGWFPAQDLPGPGTRRCRAGSGRLGKAAGRRRPGAWGLGVYSLPVVSAKISSAIW
jgi:hypothetical protein